MGTTTSHRNFSLLSCRRRVRRRSISKFTVTKPSFDENDDPKSKLVNLNSAPIDRLLSVPGLTPVLVKRIVQRRQRKGPFRFIEDLLEIRGVDYIVLAQVRPHVTVNSSSRLSTSLSQSSIENVHQPILSGNRRKTRVGSSITDTFSIASQLFETLPLELQTLLLTSPPVKVTPKNDTEKSKFRFASWNLNDLTKEKVRNPGVREVICRTIFDNDFSLIGFQEIECEEALNGIVNELNSPTLPSLKDFINFPTKRWKSIVHATDSLGFIYDESFGIEFKEMFSVPSDRCRFVVKFCLNETFDWIFVNLHVKNEKFEENENDLIETIELMTNEKSLILFVSGNLRENSRLFQSLIDHQYQSMIDSPTDIHLHQNQGSICLDKIWLSSSIKCLATENAGVIRDHLTSVWIPVGWTWGGFVSNHCPIWTEFDLKIHSDDSNVK